MAQMLSKLGFMVLFASALITAPASTVHAQNQGAPFPSFNCDAPGANLQTAIDHAPNGATIFFGGNCDDGPYNISHKNLHLRGFSSGGTLSAPGKGAVVEIFYAHVILSRLEINATDAPIGIEVTGGTVEIDDVHVHDSDSIGIQLRNSSAATISDSVIEDNDDVGIAVTDSSSADIGGSEVANKNEISGSITGVEVDVNSSITLRENLIEGNDDGVVCGFSGALTVAVVQDFGTGNGAGAADNADVDAACHLREFVDDSDIP